MNIFYLSLDRQVKMSKVCLCEDPRNLLMQKASSFKTIFVCVHSCTLRRKPVLVFPVCETNSLTPPYPALGRSVGQRPVLGPCLLQAVQRLALSFLYTRQKHSEP